MGVPRPNSAHRDQAIAAKCHGELCDFLPGLMAKLGTRSALHTEDRGERSRSPTARPRGQSSSRSKASCETAFLVSSSAPHPLARGAVMANAQVTLSLPVLRKGPAARDRPDSGETTSADVKSAGRLSHPGRGWRLWLIHRGVGQALSAEREPRRRRDRRATNVDVSLVQVALAVGARLNARAYRPPPSASGRAPIEEAFAIA